MALGLGIGFPFFARNEDCRWYSPIVKTTSSTSCSYSPHFHPAPDKVQPTRTTIRSVSPSSRSCGLSPVPLRFSKTSSKIDQKYS
jgi:hypothetical protein